MSQIPSMCLAAFTNEKDQCGSMITPISKTLSFAFSFYGTEMAKWPKTSPTCRRLSYPVVSVH